MSGNIIVTFYPIDGDQLNEYEVSYSSVAERKRIMADCINNHPNSTIEFTIVPELKEVDHKFLKAEAMQCGYRYCEAIVTFPPEG